MICGERRDGKRECESKEEQARLGNEGELRVTNI